MSATDKKILHIITVVRLYSITSKLNWPISFNRPDSTSSTVNNFSLDSKDDFRPGCQNVIAAIARKQRNVCVKQLGNYYML